MQNLVVKECPRYLTLGLADREGRKLHAKIVSQRASSGKEESRATPRYEHGASVIGLQSCRPVVLVQKDPFLGPGQGSTGEGVNLD